MPKLFIAADLPRPVTAELALLQPSRRAGVRLVKRDQMHLTLHYLGKAGIERMAAALRTVGVPALLLTFEGLGHFVSSDGAITLWARVRPNAELRSLHATIAAALAGEGFQPEGRPYTPHVTLARCGSEVPATVVDEFLAQGEVFSLGSVPITRFGLYSSVFLGDTPVYRREQTFWLTDSESETEGAPKSAPDPSCD